MSCEICGRFVATSEFHDGFRSYARDERYLLSAVTRNAAEQGQTLELTTDKARELLNQTPWPSATEQATRLLSHIARKAQTRGAAVTVNHDKDYPLFFAKGREDVSFLARELINAGLIKRTDVGAVPRYAMTLSGYEELQRRQQQAPAPDLTPARPREIVNAIVSPSGAAAPHMQTPQQAALDMIDSALAELDIVARAQPEGSGDRILRWCERTTQRLRETVAQREAERFAELVPILVSNATHASHITDRCRAFLLALRADIELSPGMVKPALPVRAGESTQPSAGGSSPTAPAPVPAPPRAALGRIWRFMHEHGWAFEGIGTQAILWGITILAAGVFALWRWWGPPAAPSAPTASPTTPAQAQNVPRAVFDLVVEGRLACSAPQSPTTEESGPGSAAEPAYLEGEAGYEELQPLQPVRVLRAGKVATLVNRFGLSEASRLRGSSIEYLLGFEQIRIPIMVSASTKWECLGMQSYEITVSLNGSEVWSKRQPLGGRRWQTGGSFGTDLKPLHSQLRERMTHPSSADTP